MKKIIDRLNRAQGQIASIKDVIESGSDCKEVIPQLLAIKGAVDGIVQVYLEEAIDTCVDCKDIDKAKTVIKTLVKNI